VLRLIVDFVQTHESPPLFSDAWAPLLESIEATGRAEFLRLDRVNSTRLCGVRAVPFPEYRLAQAAHDSLLIQHVCDAFDVDVFISNGLTSPVGTASVVMVNDRLARSLERDSEERLRLEVESVIAFAQGYVCADESVLELISSKQPEVPRSRMLVASLADLWTVGSVACVDATPGTDPADRGDVTARTLLLLEKLAADQRACVFQAFFSEWRQTRLSQARVASLFDCA
jgi:hypothetical protein